MAATVNASDAGTRRRNRVTAVGAAVAAVLVLLVSFNGPLVTAGAASAATQLTLAAMHVAVGAVLIPMLAGTTRDRSRP